MFNFLPVRRENYCIGVPYAGVYEEVFTSDAAEFGGTGFTNGNNIRTVDEAMHGFEQSISLTLPENTVFFLRCKRKAAKKPAAKTTKTTAKKPAAKKAQKPQRKKPDSFYMKQYTGGGKMPERSKSTREGIISHVT